MNIFEREKLLIGDKINDIHNKAVLVIGLGGVGGYVLEGLARAGITKLIIVDYDIIDITNINRQIIALSNNIGLKKVDEWEKRLKLINNNIDIIKLDLKVNIKNINELFKYKIDYLIDACDTILVKKELIRKCIKHNIKFISSMGTGNKLDPLQFEIIDVRKTTYDPIARIIRKMIKDEHIKNKIMVVCSKEKPKKMKKIIGSISYVPSVAGLLCVKYVIDDILRGEL